MSLRRPLASTLLASLALLGGSAGWADGDTFFNSAEVPGNPQYVIFGSVKDMAGHYLKRATVTVSVVQHMLEVSSQTDVLGRYRTPDIGREIEELGYPVNAALIIVSVDYPGYHIAHREYRGKYRQNKGAVEIDFQMTKNAVG